MPDRQCTGCTRQKEWGCEAKRWRTPNPDEPDGKENWVKPAYLSVSLGDEESFACPRQTIREHPAAWSKMLMFYSMFSKGHLPDKGAIVDQSNVMIQLFRIIEEANAECDREEREREQRRQSREANKPGARRR
ncbi:hypothetical protein [Hyphomicrobium sp.]|uniref:hypothetical protein n=1 Tax=Hyphomicrobium sp. TaxID=82 RepID=UPI001D3CB363|nr:hypothetical protein [Hyphomicrobium sp.]MBY0560012.1 hypothetical protein [Hyphomicrobium sp.]